MSVTSAHFRRAGRRILATLRRRWGTALILAAAACAVIPIEELGIGTERATECLARYAEPRGPEHPECGAIMTWFVFPSHVPWTATRARYRAEEFAGRMRLADYLDAAVGRPDRVTLARDADDVEAAELALAKGSQRLALEELGASMGAPDLGKAAEAQGDRATLLRAAGRWNDWPVRMHAMEAALLEGDLPRASAMAKRYAEFDPRDEDLRAEVGAVLCLGADPKRGLELLETVEVERARNRHAGMARNWGEVRAVIVACAAIAKVAPPAKPFEEAGQADYVAARAAQRIRVTTDTIPRAEAIEAAITMLRGPIRARGGRLAVLAELLATGVSLAPEVVGELASPHVDESEGPLVPPDPMTIAALLDAPRGVRPTARIDALLDAADALLKLSGPSSPARLAANLPASTLAGDLLASVLRDAAGALLLEAGASIARSGRADEAAKAMKLGGDLALGDADLRRIARSSAYYLAGDAARALAEIEGDAAPPNDAPSATDDPTDPTRSSAYRAAAMAQRAEILASLGRRRDAETSALAADALGAEAAQQEGARAVSMYTRWTRLALARPSGRALREDPSAPPISSPPRFQWIGFAEATMAWARPEASNERAIAETLGAWSAAVALPPEGRRAMRYQAYAHRGDAPPAHVAYLTLAADLLGPGEGDVELWLDTFDAVDARRFSLRACAWYRAEAARWRGDAESAATWSARFHKLGALAADPARMEIAQFLGI